MYFLSLSPAFVTLDKTFVQHTLLSPSSGPGTSRSGNAAERGRFTLSLGTVWSGRESRQGPGLQDGGMSGVGWVGADLAWLPREHSGLLAQSEGKLREAFGARRI